MRLKKLTVRGFRGFNEEQLIPLNSDVILIYGLNGSGKSSFTEAIEWLFFDEISRQRLSRCKSEYQYEEYLRNLFYSSSDNPFVELEGIISGKSILLKKEITSEGNRLFIDGNEVKNFDSLNLNLENCFRPMLAQTEIKALVDSEQKDRWEQLSSILGQDDLTKLRENLINLRNKKKDESYKLIETKWNAIISDVSDLETLSSLIEPIKQLDLSTIVNELQKIIGSQARTLDELLREARNKQKSLFNTELGKRVAEVSYKESEELKENLDKVLSHFKELEAQAIKSTSGGHDHKYLEFLRTGISYAKPPECPFCLARSLKAERLTEIDKSLEQGKDAQEAKTQFQQRKENIDQWIQLFPDKIKGFLPQQQELKVISQKFLDIEEEEIASLIQDFERKVGVSIKEFQNAIISACEYQFTDIENKYFHGQKDIEVSKKIEKIIREVIVQSESIISEWEKHKTKIADKIPFSGQANQEELKKWLTVEKIIVFFIKARIFIEQTYLLNRVDKIQAKLEQYEKDEVSRLLKEHAGEIKKYYEKLNPGDQIQFSSIEVKGGTRRQAKLKAKAFGKEVNPVTFFSEAHSNSLALSIYFPQRVDRNETWETIILDDPIQSMDENHSQALIDILVDLSAKKQVIVLTHSKGFFKRLCSRFYHLKPEVYSFFYNDEKGPSIILDQGETLEHLKLIKENCEKGDPRSLETASQQLRKAIESVCFELLLDKGDSFSKARKIQKKGFESLFIEVEKLGLPPPEIGKLESLLDTSHSASHAWSIADSTPGGIRKGMQYIQDIYDNYLK